MVVCKCRKATKLYCFVHKVPVCGMCICENEHENCVVRTYSDWVIDGDYDWPPTCSICNGDLQAETGATRLACLHVFHKECLVKHLQGFPLHTAPAGYSCPECLTPVWPPKSFKDYTCSLVLKLKEVIAQNGLSEILLGSDAVTEQHVLTPPAFDSAPLSNAALESTVSHDTINEPSSSKLDIAGFKEGKHGSDITNDAYLSVSLANLTKTANQSAMSPGTVARKSLHYNEKAQSAYPGDDEESDERKKYSRRGSLQKQAFRYLPSSWSNTLTTLPIKDDHHHLAEEIIEGRPRRRPRSSGVNTNRILLVIAIMSCMATMMFLYYRLLQGNPMGNIGQLNGNMVAEGQGQ